MRKIFFIVVAFFVIFLLWHFSRSKKHRKIKFKKQHKVTQYAPDYLNQQILKDKMLVGLELEEFPTDEIGNIIQSLKIHPESIQVSNTIPLQKVKIIFSRPICLKTTYKLIHEIYQVFPLVKMNLQYDQ